MMQATAFKIAWVVVGVAALAGYAALPVSMLSSADAESVWTAALWLVPAAFVVAGLVVGPRSLHPGAICVLVGGFLLGPNTLLYLGLGGVESATLPMLGCQITLMGAGVAGLGAVHRPGRIAASWAVLLATPLIVLVLTLGGMSLLWSPEGRAEADAFPRAVTISFEEPSRGFNGTWEMGGKYDVPLAEAVSAQRSALEAAGWDVRTEGWEASAEGGVGEPSLLTASKAGWLAELGFEQFGEPGVPAQGTVMVRLWPQPEP
jgi:hypothetical protein